MKRQYKVVSTLLDFQVIIHQYITLARSFGPLASDVSGRVKEIMTIFNEMVCQDILGAAAGSGGKIQHINARHLCKYGLYSVTLLLYSPRIKLHLLPC